MTALVIAALIVGVAIGSLATAEWHERALKRLRENHDLALRHAGEQIAKAYNDVQPVFAELAALKASAPVAK